MGPPADRSGGRGQSLWSGVGWVSQGPLGQIRTGALSLQVSSQGSGPLWVFCRHPSTLVLV